MGAFFVDFNEEVESLDRMIVEMKERVSEARTVQASYLFQRFTRTIRELSRETGKNIDLIVAGGDTPIDRVIFDGLYDPMLHIVRNSVAHGIEQRRERLHAGKLETGTIWMSAKRKGNTLEIEVRDDGRGIQLDKVRQRAEEKGFLEPGEHISDSDLTQMIFRSGFSTAESTDTTSGRGIGMNVVMDRLASLSGSVDILSVPGNGTTFRLTLPLSLVIINVIHFKVGRLSFVIPTNLVAEIIYFPPGAVLPEIIEHGDENIPVVDLKKVFRIPAEASDRAFAIVSQASGKTLALLVDAVVSQEDTVIKPFGDFLREMPHLAGGSIGGDGSLRLVINPARLLAEVGVTHTVTESSQLPVEPESLTVLVVDDSLSVRKYAGMILNANGFKVLFANNGFEALEVLENNKVDFIITDLEMPLMHGYELLAELTRRGVMLTTPVAVLSSRAGQQHRDKAFELGARDYLVKPFEEDTLLAMLRRHLPDFA
jgi:chemosensory pili system protein ChpA (sensor histidine kinase/response regulator)